MLIFFFWLKLANSLEEVSSSDGNNDLFLSGILFYKGTKTVLIFFHVSLAIGSRFSSDLREPSFSNLKY